MNSTSTVEVSIQAVSAPFSSSASAAAGSSPATASGRSVLYRVRAARLMSNPPVSSDFCLECVRTGLAGTDTYGLLQVGDENLAVADLAGVRGVG